MEIDGLVTRTSFNEIPPRVEYSLITAAKELNNVFKELEIWANRHFSK